MTTFRWDRTPTDAARHICPLPGRIPETEGVAVDMQCRGGHERAEGSSDLFDALVLCPGVVLVLLMNVAKQSHKPVRLLAMAQDVFRAAGTQLSEAMTTEAAEPSLQTAGTGWQNVGESLLEVLAAIRQSLDAASPLYYATGVLALYNATNSTLTWVSAGAPPMLLKSGGKVEIIEAAGEPLGLPSSSSTRKPEQDAHSLQLRPGAAAMFLTTGLVGARPVATLRSGEFSMERAARALAAATTTDAQQLCRAVVSAAIRFEKQPGSFGPPLRIPGFKAPEEDDMTAVAIVRPG